MGNRPIISGKLESKEGQVTQTIVFRSCLRFQWASLFSLDLVTSRYQYAYYSESIRDQRSALENARVTLSISRYTRRNMLDALSSTAFSRTPEYGLLVQETVFTCIPKAFSEGSQYHCGPHRHHSLELFRHCGTGGELIHIQVRLSCAALAQ